MKNPMRNFRKSLTLTCLMLLAAGAYIGAVQSAANDSVRHARVAPVSDPRKRCPDLQPAKADDTKFAVVRFLVGPTGVPSQASVKTSSQSEDLDRAAVECVMNLRFLPATEMGSGAAVASWQEFSWKWGHPKPRAGIVIPASAAEVHVCVDAMGKLSQEPKLIHSSGDAQFDAAALKIAGSGSGNYRASATTDGKPLPGCLQMAIQYVDK
jgi:TonB family protein